MTARVAKRYTENPEGRQAELPADAVRHRLVVPADVQASLSGQLDYEHLHALVDGLMEGSNLFYAVRADGHFASVTTRSVPRQEKPFPRWSIW
jgi:alpha-acetolactate decarboxylase